MNYNNQYQYDNAAPDEELTEEEKRAAEIDHLADIEELAIMDASEDSSDIMKFLGEFLIDIANGNQPSDIVDSDLENLLNPKFEDHHHIMVRLVYLAIRKQAEKRAKEIYKIKK